MNIDFPQRSVTLNAEQYAVVTADPYESQRVLAAAGSGKTTTITARISWLITQCGVDASQIVLLTFSRNAAHEMVERVRRLIGPVDLWSGTFHALALRVLKGVSGVSGSAGEGGGNGGGGEVVTASNYFIDELPVLWYNWMRTKAGREWVGKIRYVVVDEFQDINEIQWKILEVLRHPGVRTIIVGDDAQNIYTWRGSSANYLLNYHQTVRRVKDYQLKVNYRSSPAIVDVANRIMLKIPTLPWKEHMVAGQGSNAGTQGRSPGYTKPDVLFFWKAIEECKWIARTILDIRRVNPSWTIGILGRNNAELYRAEEVFLHEGLDVRLQGGVSGVSGSVGGDGGVDLMTFHGSKGLEWDVVFLICLTDDALPSRKGAEDIIGERRLFYVAVTRARRRLFLTYNGAEHKLSRFVREIGSHFLTYHGLAKYALSTVENKGCTRSIRGLLESLDGVQWHAIRTRGLLPNLEKLERRQILPPGEFWSVPSWADPGIFCNFVRLFLKRSLGNGCSCETSGDIFIQQMLFTLRIFREDMAFWELWRNEIHDAMMHFFRDRVRLPGAELSDIEAWALEHGIDWTLADLIQVTKILGKIRGQLVPLRYVEYRLDEFHIGVSNSVVPTEYRVEVLRSWRRYCDRDVDWRDCLVDIWRLACLEQVASGRNAGLFHIAGIMHRLGEVVPFLECVERYIGNGGVGDNSIQLNPSWCEQGFAPVVGDWIQGTTLVRIGGEQKPDIQQWVETCLLAYLLYCNGADIRSVQIYHLFYGTSWLLADVNMKAMKELLDVLLEAEEVRADA